MAKSPDSAFLGTLPLPVPGVRLESAAAGLRYRGRDDVAVIELCEGAVKTTPTNKVSASRIEKTDEQTLDSIVYTDDHRAHAGLFSQA